MTKATTLLLFLLVQPAPLLAQTIVRPTVSIPRQLALKSLGSPHPTDTVTLQWTCGDSIPDTSLPVGTVYTRQRSYKGTTVSYSDTVKSLPLRPPEATPVPLSLRDFEGEIFVDEKEPSILRVNPFLWRENLIRECRGVNTEMSPQQLRETQFFYRLKDRQSISFRTEGWSVGAATIPIRVRPGYTASNGQEIETDVSSQFSIGLYGGRAWGRVGYTYVEHGRNALVERRRITLAGFVALSSESANPETSRSSDVPLTRTVKFVTVAPGLAIMANIRGIDVGIFGGPEYAIGSRHAQTWDYHRRLWGGFGIGYQVPK
jgi:hypothetical protein